MTTLLFCLLKCCYMFRRTNAIIRERHTVGTCRVFPNNMSNISTAPHIIFDKLICTLLTSIPHVCTWYEISYSMYYNCLSQVSKSTVIIRCTVTFWSYFIYAKIGTCCTSYSTLGGPRSFPSRPTDIRLRPTTRTNCHMYTFLPPDDGLLAGLKHIEV
jgi:hypothetical protein